MCGRYVSASPPSEIAKYFGAALADEQLLEPSFNVAPTNEVYAVLEADGARLLDHLRWGLVPHWAKDLSIGSRMINARADGVATKNAFRQAFKSRRCLLPADGFYEWQAVPGQKRKQPMFIHRRDDEPLAFAGLWERWRGPDKQGETVRTCTVITTEANAMMAPIHDRMPVILPPERWAEWLDPENHDTEHLASLLVPAPPTLLIARPVSTAVNHVRNKGPELIAAVDGEVGPAGDAPSLF